MIILTFYKIFIPMKKKLKKHLADGLLIVFSVLFALFINKLYDDYQLNKKREIAIQSIVKELYKNESIIKDWKIRHTQVNDKLKQLIDGKNDSLKSNIKNQTYFNLGLLTDNKPLIDDVLTSTSWESAKSTGIISEFEFETTQRLTRVYALQELISEKTISKILDYYFEPSTHEMEDIEAILIQFQLRFTELVGQEMLMAYLYDDSLNFFKEQGYNFSNISP